MCMKACAHVLCVCVPVAMGVQVLPYFSSNGRPLGSIDHGQLDIIIWGYGVSVSLLRQLLSPLHILIHESPPRSLTVFSCCFFPVLV